MPACPISGTQDLIDRSDADLDNHPDIKPLFPDPTAEGLRYYKKTGIYPINHGMVVKRAVFERNPWVVINILKAFDRGKRHRRSRAARACRLSSRDRDLCRQNYRKPLATQIISHGLKANRATLELAAKYSNQQGLTPRIMTMDELFAPNALDS